ncbi:MAG: extracellular solute-binding protein [Anaerolineales bacterium]|nr:extracellular solute-binding protein [Anaerolineales bacterium]
MATLTALAVTDAAPVPADATAGPADEASTPAAPVPSETAPAPTETALAPTGGAPAPTESAPAATTLTLWHTWTDAQLQALQPELEAFAADHPEVAINLLPASNNPQPLADTFDTNAAPDLLAGSTGELSDLTGTTDIGLLNPTTVDLETLADAAAAKGAATYDQSWAVPFSKSGLALVYNKAILPSEYLPSNPDDLNDLLQKALAYKRAFLSQYPLCIAANDAYHLAPIYFGFGLPAYVDEAGQGYLDTPEALAAGQWLADISPVVYPGQSDELCQSAFLESTVAMWWTGPESLPAIQAAGIDYGILPMGRPYVEVQAFMLTPQAAERGNAALAVELIQRLTSPEAQKALALAGAIIPVEPTVLADPEVAQSPNVAGYVAALARGLPLPTYPYADAQWDIVANASEMMWHRVQTPEEALTAAQAALVAEVAKIAGNITEAEVAP